MPYLYNFKNYFNQNQNWTTWKDNEDDLKRCLIYLDEIGRIFELQLLMIRFDDINQKYEGCYNFDGIGNENPILLFEHLKKHNSNRYEYDSMHYHINNICIHCEQYLSKNKHFKKIHVMPTKDEHKAAYSKIHNLT